MDNSLRILSVFGVAAFFGSTTIEVNAAMSLYTDRATWEAAAGTFSTEDFNGFGSDTDVSGGASFAGFSTGAATTSEGVFVDIPPFLSNPGTADIDGTARLNIRGLEAPNTLVINFDTPVSGFGFDTANYDIGDERLEVFANGTTSIGLFPLLRGQTGFVGVIDDAGTTFTSVVLASDPASLGQEFVFNALDNVSITTATTPPVAGVPEPSHATSMLLLAFAALARRSRKA